MPSCYRRPGKPENDVQSLVDIAEPQAAQNLIDQIAASLPQIKITELLLEVDK